MKTTTSVWLYAFGLSLITASTTNAAIVYFTNSAADSDYSDGTNWSSGTVPTGDDQVYLGDATNTPRSAVYSSSTDQTTSSRFIIGYTTGNGSLTMKASSGTLQFGGDGYTSANWVGVDGGTGTLTMEGGTLKIDNGSATGGASLGVGTNNNNSHGTLNVSGGLIDIVSGRLMAGLNNTTTTSVINLSGDGVINVGVSGTYGESGWFRMGSGNNTVNLDGGTLALKQIHTGAANGLRSNVYFNGGTIKSLDSTTDFINGNTASTDASGANLQMKDGGLTFDTNSFDVAINDKIRQVSGQTGQLTKTGAGTLTLGATMDWTGATTVEAGTLMVNANGDISASVTTAQSTATLAGSGILGEVTIEDGGFISPGVDSVGNLTITGDLTLAGTYLWQIDALSTATINFDSIIMTAGNAVLTGATLELDLGSFAPSVDAFWETDQTWVGILNNTGIGSLTDNFGAIDNSAWSSLGSFRTVINGNDIDLVWTAVPEPSIPMLTLLALTGFLRRKRAIAHH